MKSFVTHLGLALAGALIFTSSSFAQRPGNNVSAARGSAERPDRACASECRSAYRTCVDSIVGEARLCAEACSDLVAEARDICGEDRSSDECAAARAAARECLQPCRDGMRAGVRECRETARICVADCPRAEPIPPKDPACVGDCRAGLSACLENARTAADECSAACEDLVASAREICSTDRRSDECRRARSDAVSCLRPCRSALSDARRECASNGRECVASCPDAEIDAQATASIN